MRQRAKRKSAVTAGGPDVVGTGDLDFLAYPPGSFPPLQLYLASGFRANLTPIAGLIATARS